MVAIAPDPQVVPVQPIRPNRYGLLVAATQITDGERWQGGIEWLPEAVNGGDATVTNCLGNTGTLDTDPNRSIVNADPFVIYAEDHCSTFGWQVHDYEGRARRQLEAQQSYLVAKELWSGALANANSLRNLWLTKDPDILAGTLSPEHALGLIDQGLGVMLGGSRGMIHVSPYIFDLLKTNNSIDQVGQLWQTPMGTVVVADAGYPGTKPDGSGSTKQWIYATGWVNYRLSEVIVPGDGFSQWTLRSTNLITVFAERLVLLQWDSEIPAGSKAGVLAVETDVLAFPGL